MDARRARRGARGRWVPALVAATVAAGTLAWVLGPTDRGPQPDAADQEAADHATPSASAPAPVAASPATPARREGTRPEAPVEVQLPSGTSLQVRAVATRPDGVLDVPDDVRTAGWWRGGSRLGDPFGATLVAAHIDSEAQGLGPYAELLRAHRGDQITVDSRNLTQRFRVSSLRLLPRSSLAGVTDLFSAAGPRRLVLVTCAGPFDEDRGGYQNLAVVTARPLTLPRTRSS